MLIDTVQIKIQSGKGGEGSNSTFKNRNTGGDGGQGGKVFIEGNENIYDLRNLNPDKIYKAENGRNGGNNNKTGASGKDIVIQVPLTTEVYIKDSQLVRITKHKQKELLLSGGKGKPGNVSIGRNPKLLSQKQDSDSKFQTIDLILKLQSDIILIGYPNAGKSSLLNALTSAHAKTASYPFTTLDPQLGYAGNIKLMDLPGLIKGSSKGKGLGIKFLKHTENAKLAAYIISLDTASPYEIYKALRLEVRAISQKLYNMNKVIILSKNDEVDSLELKKNLELFRKEGLPVETCSIIDDDSVDRIKKFFQTNLFKNQI